MATIYLRGDDLRRAARESDAKRWAEERKLEKTNPPNERR